MKLNPHRVHDIRAAVTHLKEAVFEEDLRQAIKRMETAASILKTSIKLAYKDLK